MPSTYTTNLRLTKQADGENPNTWGEVLNEGMISLVDHAIAGYTSISVGTTATVTLTENQGSGDQSRSAVLEFKGTIGGSHNNIDVLIPNNSKLYVVKNSITYTDSTDSLVLKVAGNTGVTIPAGTVALYVTNGVTTQAVEKTNLSSLTVTGAARFDSTVTVSGVADFKTNISVGGTFIATGASRFDSTVTVSGKGKFMTGALTPIVTLTDAASVATDLNTGNVFYVTLAGNRTLAAPTETTTNIGAVGQIFIQQDGTGSRTLSYNTVFQFPGASVPTLTTTANAVDTLFYAVRTTTKVDAILVKNFNRS
jgi:hypothetical protein